MKTLILVQRILATVIDLIIVYLPALLLSHTLFRNMALSSIADLLASLLFVLYSSIAVASFSGKTIGKYFAKLKVETPSMTLADVAQREGVKVLYFIPYAGVVFLLISFVIYFSKGKFLHDWAGRSRVYVS